ncbi:MAG: malate dehydrogenase [Bdellovibrionaceae bacterium]|nr:malate dehydrogenase [Pseudobdellovibrionaceae bacterium]
MSHKRKKVTVVGSGFVGSSCATWILARDLADVSLIDINEGLAKGRALDLFSASPALNSNINLKGGSDYSLAEDSDAVVITAGLARKPGMSRSDLLLKNSQIMKSICHPLKEICPQAIFIIVSNPLDAMVSLAHDILSVSREKILGMAGVLDTARFKAFVAEKLNCSVKDISALVLGGHGDSMLPLIRYATVGGVPLSVLMSEKNQEVLIERTKKGGGEIVSLLKTGSAHYAPAVGVVEMLESILKDQKRILPCSALLKGEYGEKDVFVGVPCQLGGKGLEKVVEIPLNTEEQKLFQNSVQSVKSLIKEMKELLN